MSAATIHITDIEAAINYWRAHTASAGRIALPGALIALAEVYGSMVYLRKHEINPTNMPAPAMKAWLHWYHSTPDTPCIAICSTSQGDAHCKGCGRSFAEIQQWLSMNPVEKRAVWRRITIEGTALRFTRYAERRHL